MNALQRAARASRLLTRATEQDGQLGTLRWLPPQKEFMAHPSKRKLLRAGQQAVGKTTALLADLVFRCLGDHPWLDVPPPPIQAWLICASWSQSIEIQAKLWAMVPKPSVHPDQRFDPIRGFGGHQPALRFANGSMIRIKTSQQGALSLAGATIDVVGFDEPPTSRRLFAEVEKRVQSRNGTVMLSLTPINADCDWLREACEEKKIEDLHYPLKPEYLIPVGSSSPLRLSDGTVCDQTWIDGVRAQAHPWELDIVADGAWEGRSGERYFDCFISKEGVEGSHVIESLPDLDLTMCIGVDFGTQRGNQSAILIGVDDRPSKSGHPTIYVLDEVHVETRTSPEQDAKGIVAMLKRNDVAYRDVSYFYADIDARSDNTIARKGILDLGDCLAIEMGLKNRKQLFPKIYNAKRGRRRKDTNRWGFWWMYQRILQGEMFIHKDCHHLIESFDKFDGLPKSEWKHALDGLHYGLTYFIRRGTRRGGSGGATLRVR